MQKAFRRPCVMMPKLEFRCRNDINILGLKITHEIPGDDRVTVASHIGVVGPPTILAHSGRNGHQCPRELCGVLHGIEIGNAAYFGRFVPHLPGLRLLDEATRINPSIGVRGADLQPTGQRCCCGV